MQLARNLNGNYVGLAMLKHSLANSKTENDFFSSIFSEKKVVRKKN